MSRSIELHVRLWPSPDEVRSSPHGPDVEGTVRKSLLASTDADNEENAVQLAERVVREAFARHRAQSHIIIRQNNGVGFLYLIKSAASQQRGDVCVFRGSAEACIVEASRLKLHDDG